MTKQFKLTPAFLLLAVLGVIIWQVLPPHRIEPAFQGKPLRYWFQQYADLTPSTSEATNAIQQVGKAAVPFLVQILDAPDPWWQKRYDAVFQRLPRSLATRLPYPVAIGKTRAARLAALDALALIAPSDEEALAAVIKSLNASDIEVRRSAPLLLGQLGPKTTSVIPALVNALTNNDWYAEENALRALAAMGPAATNTIPVLENALKHGHPDFQTFAAEGLGNIGPGAKAATPSLLTAM